MCLCPFSCALHHVKAHLWQLCTQNESVTSSPVSWDAQTNFVFSSSLSCQIQLCSLVELSSDDGLLNSNNRSRDKGKNFKFAFLTWLLLAILRKYEEENNLADYFAICFHMVILFSLPRLKSLLLCPVCETLADSPISMSWPFPSLLFRDSKWM